VSPRILAALGAGIALACGPAVARSAAALTISPATGTPDASPSTQISILGVAPGLIEGVRVTGSVSGAHRGSLRDYSGGRGASFVLRRPLTQGERVSVVIRVRGRPSIREHFSVARLAPVPPVLDIVKLQPAKLDHFVSAPQLLAPRITVNRGASKLQGDVFLTPLPSPEVHPQSNNALTLNPVGPGGPMIVDSHGRLVWFDQLAPPVVAANFRPQRFLGRTVLTWWQGKVTFAAFGLGVGVIADSSYRTLELVRAGNGYQADLHEFRLTPSGDALLTVNSLVLVRLPRSRTLSPLLDSIVQEVDVRTGLVVWEWHAFGHIPLADSYATPATSFYDDAYHLNSVQPLRGGRVLVSARDTSAVYEIDRATGRIIWTLGGKASSFRLARGARFWFQHDAQLLSGNRVSLFDDEGGPPSFARSSRGLILALDLRHHTARVARAYRRPGTGTLADSEGSLQTLAGGNVFVGFGSARFFSLFTPRGRPLFDASLPVDDGSYREFSFPWRATPASAPMAVGRRLSPARVAIYVSWNGATEVARWKVLAGGRTLASTPAAGFETRILVRSMASTFKVRALDASGRVLSTTKEVKLSCASC
jgi:outer membrane protein assembly factor BamB